MRRFSILIFLFGFIYGTQCFFIPIRFGNPFKIINKEVKKVIEYDNKIVGSGTLLIEEKMTYGGCKMGHIENILIDVDVRGKKLGTKIMHELVKIADEQKCYRVDLVCENKLVKFYKPIGFNDSLICMTLFNKHHFK